MSLQQRRAAILEHLQQGHAADVGGLAERFGVSTMTIRRDLDWLEGRGLALRTHGGAVGTPPGLILFRFDDRRMAQAADCKDAIAERAAQEVRPGMQILLDTGTTTLRLARWLRPMAPLTVLTTSLAVAAELYAAPGIEVLLLGGTVRDSSPDLTGGLTEENLSRFRVDVGFLGADGADRQGPYCDHTEVARLSQRMTASAQRSVLLLDSAKFAHPAFMRYASWSDIDMIITDDAVADEDRRWLARCPSEIVYADAAS